MVSQLISVLESGTLKPESSDPGDMVFPRKSGDEMGSVF